MFLNNDSYLFAYMQYGDEETDKYASKVQKVDFFSYYIILIFDRTEVLIVFSTEIHSAST
jgi:hypothetical protein